ncbi:MAG: hypothetical protein NC336_00655 [Clostridium sp.]|nr:hypothetical protein [Clostridium sp.]
MSTDLTDTVLIDLLREAESLTRRGMTDESVALSGEILARTVSRLDDSDGHDPSLSEWVAEAGVVHRRALSAAGLGGESIRTAVALLMRLVSTGADTIRLAVARHALLSETLRELTAYVRRCEGEDSPAEVRDHYTLAFYYLTSLLYADYRRICAEDPDNFLLPAVYLQLRQLKEEGIPPSWPTVRVCGREIPSDCPSEIYGDLIGRLRAVMRD